MFRWLSGDLVPGTKSRSQKGFLTLKASCVSVKLLAFSKVQAVSGCGLLRVCVEMGSALLSLLSLRSPGMRQEAVRADPVAEPLTPNIHSPLPH